MMGAQQSRISTATRLVRREARGAPQHVSADICVLGAGIAGISAALEAARLRRKVANRLDCTAPARAGQYRADGLEHIAMIRNQFSATWSGSSCNKRGKMS
jgi:hypothetical protein